MPDRADQFSGRPRGIQDERPIGRLERSDLTPEQRGGHVVPLAPAQSFLEKPGLCFEMDESNVVSCLCETLPECFFQRGARENAVLAPIAQPGNQGAQRVEPGQTILIAQRIRGAHLFDVPRGVQVIGIEESPAERPGKFGSDRRLSCPRNSHDHDDHGSNGRMIGLR